MFLAECLVDHAVFINLPTAASPRSRRARLRGARQECWGRDYDAAMASILDAVVADREFQEGLARRAMVLCFVVVGEEDERLDAFRRRLATLLY